MSEGKKKTTPCPDPKAGDPAGPSPGKTPDGPQPCDAEGVLAKLLKRQEAILAAVPDIIMEVDGNKVYTWANRAGMEFFGKDVIGKDAFGYFEGEQNTYETVQPLFHGDENVIYVESWQRRKDGVKRLLAWWCRALKDAQGATIGAISTARDITESKQMDAALKESENRYRQFSDVTMEGIAIHDKGVLLDANPAFLRMFGYDELKELEGRDVLPIIFDRKHHALIRERIRTNSAGIAELAGIRRDGTRFPVETEGREIVYRGRPVRVVSCRDVTQRNLTETALQKSEQLFRSLIEHSNDAITLVAADGNIIFDSPSVKLMLGYTPAERVGLKVFEFAHPDDRQEMIAGFTKFVKMPGRVMFYQGRFLDKAGAVRHMEGVRTNLLDDPAVNAIVVNYRDITERLRTEQNLRDSEERYRLLFEGSSEGILMADVETTEMKYANPAVCRMFGYTASELTKLRLPDIHPKDSVEAVFQTFQLQAGGARRMATDIPCLRKEGSVFYADIATTPVWISGRKMNAGFFTDITARREAEKKEKLRIEQMMRTEKLAGLGTLVAGVAHEVNNPNTFIMLNAPLLRDLYSDVYLELTKPGNKKKDVTIRGIPPKEHLEMMEKCLDNIMLGSERISTIVQELKDYARETPSDMIDGVDLNQIARSGITLVWNKIKTATDHFVAEYASNLPPIRGNAQRLEQIIINLLSNAAEAMRDKSKTIRLVTTSNEKDKEILLSIADEGVGMSRSTMSNIGSPFFTTRRDSGGTGLGVSIACRIAEEHGGSIEYQSEEGKGTIATLHLPSRGNGTKENSDKVQE